MDELGGYDFWDGSDKSSKSKPGLGRSEQKSFLQSSGRKDPGLRPRPGKILN